MSPYRRPIGVAVAALLGCGAVCFSPGAPRSALAASIGQLQQQISAGQNRISTLSGRLNAAASRLAQLTANLGELQREIGGIQTDLDRDRRQLVELRLKERSARVRLQQLQAFELRAEAVLSRQVVRSYESDRPDIVTVVLEAQGFQDLLERLAFAQRIRNQDAQVVARVRSARRSVASQAARLGSLELRQQALTTQVLQQRDHLDRARLGLVQQQAALAAVRRVKSAQLADTRSRLAQLRRQLARAQAQQAAAAQAAGPGAPAPRGSSSGGGFTFPLPKSAASPPGTWTLDQGVDIAAPGGTPEYAACSGTIVLHGIGGFGPWAPVLHCDAPLAAYSDVYYGHAGPGNQVPVGTHVAAGQVISEVGSGTVGVSSGPHLELGFADSGGAPIGSGSASQMMALLRQAY